jgi:hypothetical protein
VFVGDGPSPEEGCHARSKFFRERSRLLTEHQIARSWQKLFAKHELTEETVAKAEALLEGLRPESPLRHRLSSELEELRKRKLQKQA